MCNFIYISTRTDTFCVVTVIGIRIAIYKGVFPFKFVVNFAMVLLFWVLFLFEMFIDTFRTDAEISGGEIREKVYTHMCVMQASPVLVSTRICVLFFPLLLLFHVLMGDVF